MAATTSASGRSMHASRRAASPASAIQMSLTRTFQTAARGGVKLFGSATPLGRFLLWSERRARHSCLGRSRVPVLAVPAPPRPGRRGDAYLELAHEAQEVRPLEPERARRPRAIAAGLGQRRLDEAALGL